MDIAWLRDLTIVIWGLVSAIVVAVLGVILVALYRRLKVILDNMEIASTNVAELSKMAREAALPMMRIASIFQVITKTLGAIKGFRKNKKEEDCG
jgi:ABC-type sugar transport system permease subunit